MAALTLIKSLCRPGFFLSIVFLLATPLAAAPQKVSFKTADGVVLSALFVKPAAEKPTVIMLHGFSSAKEEWQPLIDQLTTSGLGSLAYDSRPAGAPWKQLVDDVGAAIRYLETTQSIDRKKKIALAGASLGANVCLKYAALTDTGKCVLLLSPGLNYQGLTTLDAIARVKHIPILIVANPSDTYAYQSAMELTPQMVNGKFWSSNKPGHGVQMFDQDLLKRLSAWLDSSK